MQTTHQLAENTMGDRSQRLPAPVVAVVIDGSVSVLRRPTGELLALLVGQ